MRKCIDIFSIVAIMSLNLACGCATVFHDAERARSSIMSGDGSAAIERAQRLRASKVNNVLGTVESARLSQLNGNMAESSSALKPFLDKAFAEENDGPLVNIADAGGQILAGTFSDDTAIPYALPSFEMLFALQYQFLNELSAGDFYTAGVYLRRATWLQEKLREKNGGAAEAVPGDDSKDDNGVAKQNAVGDIDAKLAPIANTVRASYENALVWYLRGLWLMCDDQLSNADLSFDEARKISPAISKFPLRDNADVTVVYEEGLVDLKSPVKIPLPIGGTVVSCDFPVYRGAPYRPCGLTAALGTNSTEFVKVVDVQALAYRDLKDRIPGIVTRNVTRTAVKIAAQQAANHACNNNSSAGLALQLGVLVYNAIRTAVDEADTRCWTTLPECVSLARVHRSSGEGKLTVSGRGRAIDVNLPLKSKGPLLVWITDVGAYATVYIIDVKDGVRSSSFVRTSSIIGVGDGRFR